MGGTLAWGAVTHADTARAQAALNRGDYATAWREFLESAQRGDAEAQAGIGTMLLDRLNPAGTGGYGECESWLAKAAAQGSAKGMTSLGRFYYADAMRIMRTDGRGASPASAPMAQRHAAALRFVQARGWFERAATLGNFEATRFLASMLEAGTGGSRDPARAARLRADASRHLSDTVAARHPAMGAIVSAWRAGRHAEAVQSARPLAETGDAAAQALLGRAYYEGVGQPRDYNWALAWLEKAAGQGSEDAIFFLGLMYEHGRGVAPNPSRAADLFDRAAVLGHEHAPKEAAGMRVQSGALRANLSTEQNACFAAGGTPISGACAKDGANIDPYVLK